MRGISALLLANAAVLAWSLVPAGAAPAGAPTTRPAAATRPAKPDGADRAARIARLHGRAVALAEAGKYDQCKPVLERLLQLDPANKVAWYNLACAESRLGRPQRAIDHLRRAVSHGFSDFRHMQRDADLEAVRKSPAYQQLLTRNAQIQRDRARKIRADLRRRFGAGYICEIDEDCKLVFATNIDRQTLAELKTYLTGFAEAMWGDLFGHRFEQYVTIVIPSSGDRAPVRMKGGGYYTHGQRMLVAGQIGMVLAHEFTHALHAADQDGRGQRHPIWIVEGLATLFESSRVVGGHVLPQPNHRLNLLQQLVAAKRTIPWKHFFNYTHAHFMKRVVVSYPQARYIMMYLHEKGVLKKWYDAYTAGYAADPGGAKAVEKLFGEPLDKVEADWLAWVRKLKPPPVRLKPDQAYMGVRVAGRTDGLHIQQVVPGSGAEKAGLRPGDVIVNIDGQRIVDGGALTRLVSRRQVGDMLQVRCRRDGRYVTLTVTLQPMPADLPRPRATTKPASRPTSRPAKAAG